MTIKWGDRAAQIQSQRWGEPFATTALLTALPAEHRVDKMVCVAAGSFYQFDSSATAAGAGTLAPDTGTGAWIKLGGSASDFKDSVRVASTANLAGTRTANVLLADANGAIAAMDGVTLVAGDRILMKDQSTGADRGIYVITALGGASAKWSMTRAADFDTSAKVTGGCLIPVSEGTVGGDKVWLLTTNDAITLNTTSLTFAISGPGLASATPQEVGTAAVGTGALAARDNHVHAHGNQTGGLHAGTLHDAASATVAGFMSATDKAFMAGAIKGFCVKGVAATNVADLAAFVIAGFDGVTYAENDLVLLANQTTGAECGVYQVGAVAGTAPLTRVNWMPTGAVLSGGFTVHSNTGTRFGNTNWFISTTGAITIGTTAHLWFPESVTQEAVLVAGTKTISDVPILSATKSNVLMTRKVANTSNLTVGGYCATTGGANGITAGSVGTAAVIIEACVAAGTINNADVSTLLVTIENR